MADQERNDDEAALEPGGEPSELGADEGGGPRVDQGSSSGEPGVSGTLVSDFRPGHAEPTPRTPDADETDQDV